MKAELAFIRRRLPTVIEFADNVHRDDYRVLAQDRATLARLGDDLTYALNKAELYSAEFATLWDKYHEVLRTQPEDVVGEAELYINEDDPPRRWWRVPAGAGPEWYLRRGRSWALAAAILFVGHLALYILELVG